MPDHYTLLELVRISEALRDARRDAYELARAGESGEPLRDTLHYARDLLAEFAVMSDENAKQDFAKVDAREVLARVAATPITT